MGKKLSLESFIKLNRKNLEENPDNFMNGLLRSKALSTYIEDKDRLKLILLLCIKLHQEIEVKQSEDFYDYSIKGIPFCHFGIPNTWKPADEVLAKIADLLKYQKELQKILVVKNKWTS